MIITDRITELAAEFEQMLRWHMSANDYAAAVTANRAETHPAICHTHDFIDSNESMEAAFQNVVGRESDPASDEDALLIDQAWAEWKART